MLLSSDYWEKFITVVDDEWAGGDTYRDVTSTPQTPEKKTCKYYTPNWMPH